MTPRERVLNSIAHKGGPLAIDFGGLHSSIHEQGYAKVRKFLGWTEAAPVIQDYFQMIVYPDAELLKRFGADCFPVYTKPPGGWELRFEERAEGSFFTNEWGVVLRKPKDGLFFDLYECPMQKAETLEEVRRYRFSDPEDPARVKGLRQELVELRRGTDRAIVLFCPVGGIYEHSYFLRGLQELYIDMIANPDIVEDIAARTCEWETAYFSYVLKEVGDLVDVVQMGDDLGGQNGLLFSREMYLKWYKRRERDVVDAIKRHSRAHVYMHACGAIREVLPDIIENGVEIVNPVQVQAAGMESGGLKRDFGRDLTFWGGGCDPRVLTTGSADDVEREVRRRIADLSPDGGFVFAPVHNIQATMPAQNIVRMFDVARQYQ